VEHRQQADEMHIGGLMRSLAVLAILALAAGPLTAQVSGPPVNVTTTPAGKPLASLPRAADQLALLKSDDPKLARNKKHVFDFWRIVYEAGHMDRAAEFMAPEYIQHNPNVESGRDAFVRTMSAARPKRPVQPVSNFPIISIVAERDIVVVMWARKVRDRQNPELIYEMTWLDAFRVDEKSGLITEHWDSSERWDGSGRPPGAEFFP
jgi:predicted SnoaL-like aldol condensation-catalyzing enzyme